MSGGPWTAESNDTADDSTAGDSTAGDNTAGDSGDKRLRSRMQFGRSRRLWPAGPRRWIILAAVACLALAVVLWAVWPSGGGQAPKQAPRQVPQHLVSGTVQADLLSPDQVSQLAGTQVVAGPFANQPPAAISATPAKCAVAAGPSTQSVYGHSWKAFLSVTYRDAEGTGDYTVNQVIGVFPNAGAANGAFKALYGGLAACTSAVTKDRAGRTTKWAYKVYPVTPVAAAWTATQSAGGGWACYHQARLTGSSLLQVAICEEGDGQPAVSALADALAGKVRG